MLLMEPIRIGSMEVHNRLVMPPMCTYKYGDDGSVTDEMVRYYLDRTEGGKIGLLILEHCYITRQGYAGKGQMSIEDDSKIPGLKKLVNAVHACGTKIVCQINHAGSATNSMQTGQPIVSASAITCPGRKKELVAEDLPRELSCEEIQELEDLYLAAAVRAKKAGFDGVQIHSAHGYLMNQFYSPLTNQRHDAYGMDSVENRVRFQTETLIKIRKALGDDYPILIRLGGCDYMEGGSTIEDAVEACRIFEAHGADAVDLTGGMCRYTRKDKTGPGYFGDLSRAVREAVSVPVILAGGVKKASEAEALLLAGDADLIGVGRAFLSNPAWAREEMKIQ